MRRTLPLRLRRPVPILALIALVAAAVVLTIVLAHEGVQRTTRGTGAGTVPPEPGTRVVSVKRTSANDFDPLGDHEEHHGDTRLAVDRDPGTSWSTEGYQNGRLGKAGVGLYIDADPGVDARSIEIDTPEPGFTTEIRVADGNSAPKGIGGWDKVAGGTVDSKHKRFRLHGGRHRYYLVWITALAPGKERATISEVTLFAARPKN